jgi:hypothetical protein
LGKERMSSLFNRRQSDRPIVEAASDKGGITADPLCGGLPQFSRTFRVGFENVAPRLARSMHNSHKRKYASILPDSTDGTTRRLLRLARLEISYPGAHKHYQSHTHSHGRPACIANDGGERPAAEPTPPWDASSSNASTTSNLWVPGRSIMGRSRNDASAPLSRVRGHCRQRCCCCLQNHRLASLVSGFSVLSVSYGVR